MDKILYIIHSLRRGGAENQLVRQTNALVALGKEVNILVINKSNYSFDSNEIKGRIISRNTTLGTLRELRKIVNDYDVVITFMFAASILTELSIRNKIFKPRIFHSVRVDKIAWKYSFLWRLLCARRRILFNSPVAKGVFESKGLSLIDRSYLINNIIPISGSTPSGNQISVVAHFRPQKDYRSLFQAIKILSVSHPKLVVHCYGDTYNETWMQEWIDENGLESNILIHGIEKNISEVYSKSQLVVVPTFYEGTPNAVLEAIASGCDVLTADIPINKYLADTLTGIVLYKTGSFTDMAKKFEELWGRGTPRSAGVKNMLVLDKSYSESAVVNQLLNIIKYHEK